jgi:hypothetical protein
VFRVLDQLIDSTDVPKVVRDEIERPARGYNARRSRIDGQKKVRSTTGGNKVIKPVNKLSQQGCDYWIGQKEITMRKELISQTEGQVLCLAIDHWTSRGKQSYTGMTCH